MTKPTLLAVDLSNQVYRAAAANATLTSGDKFTGGLHGFIMQVQKALQITKADAIVLCRDTKPYKRSESYPEYKAIRAHTKDEELVTRVNMTMPMVYEMAEVLGWPVWSIPGFEADDLMGHCMSQHRHRYTKIIGMTNDSDLLYFYKWPQWSIYKGGKIGVWTRADYAKEWNLDPDLMPLVLAIMGTHNEVEGIDGIGPVGAKKLALNPAELRKIRQKHGALIDRNLALISLPHPEFPKGTRVPTVTKKFHERTFLRFCAQYEINAHQSTCELFSQIKMKGLL